ncbi:MAG: hypothetical protein M3P51_07565, partial [Chloroflexota bacterium]|nr:hypothetical protein [Chloroflexota bacterium]
VRDRSQLIGIESARISGRWRLPFAGVVQRPTLGDVLVVQRRMFGSHVITMEPGERGSWRG